MTTLSREYGRAIRGRQIFVSISGLRYARESFIAAKIEPRILAPFCYKGTCNTLLFNLWLKDFLIPELKPGQVVIMDKCNVSQIKRVIKFDRKSWL